MIAALIFLASWVAAVVIGIALFGRTGCARNCDQGRNCACRGETDDA